MKRTLSAALLVPLTAGCHIHLFTFGKHNLAPQGQSQAQLSSPTPTSRPAAGPTVSDEELSLQIWDQVLEDLLGNEP